MEDESCKLATHAGNAGKLGDRVPFLKVTQMDARSAREGFLIGFGSGLAEELEGGGDPEVGQVIPIGLGQTGQVGNFPVSGFESHGAWSIKNNLSILGDSQDRFYPSPLAPATKVAGYTNKTCLRRLRVALSPRRRIRRDRPVRPGINSWANRSNP
jgi:hypothetical protein